ncbi:cytochrome P450 [Mycobacterium sp. CBMA293]|uniref:cytochrome P450 n=2 Tax=Mycolicibacterium TaxID=1866885 RepID=UPI0012DF305F|nr:MULTISPECIES: cytochrome P450 [unclassified Mycolicibacterium]MUL47355.1 cytochrome P450 [Mycolicibacterium sp. CBMA 360]MUL61468.1 cytochrome P450 [Mycolicibacterium sp. CBMA 335]MUL72203.1 cytochrome P450 [Mycolicibacterium sp. CBMA 311]MUL96370.1 cytochrome P450 [Mycolicibacterium sp. CBMA 230]MUM08807.1 cytochrome P450 [Mycolicibacterium sp. CBMA 213]
MTETVTADLTGYAPAIHLPPATGVPRIFQGLAFATSRRKFVARMAARHGAVFTCDAPVFGRTVMVTDPQLAKQLFTANPLDVGNIQPNLSRVLGKGSVFALDGSEHRLRRKLLTPPFHGKSVKNYERIFEEETLREAASWPEGKSFSTLEPMMRITLNAILRAVFGADGQHLDELRRIIPPWVTLGSRLAVLPMPARTYSRFSPWGRLAEYRRQYDEVVGRLIDDVAADPGLDQRDDVLALLLRSTYEDGTAMSRSDIADELLTLLAAGHETTAATLAWAFERISRHPEVLRRLEDEVAGETDEYRQAVLLEVQRVRTIIDFAGRHVYAPTIQLGEWVIPRGFSVIVAIDHMHEDAKEFADPERFDPQRFIGHRPSLAFLPFGGGTRRCVGAVFAQVEMDVVLRTVLRHFAIAVNSAPGEKVFSRGVAYTPKDGGRLTLRRRANPL